VGLISRRGGTGEQTPGLTLGFLACFLRFLTCVRDRNPEGAETPLGGSVAALAAIEPGPEGETPRGGRARQPWPAGMMRTVLPRLPPTRIADATRYARQRTARRRVPPASGVSCGFAFGLRARSQGVV